MRKKYKHIALATCAFSFVSALTLGACGVSVEVPDVELTTTHTVFRVGMNIDLTELIVEEGGVDYTFAITDGDKKSEIKGETYYASKSGTFTVHCTPSRYGKKGKEKTTEISIFNNAPFVSSSNATVSINYGAYSTLEWLAESIPKGISVISDTQVSRTVKYMEYYRNQYDTIPVRYYFDGEEVVGEGYTIGDAVTDWNFDGEKLYFNREGIFQVALQIENDGGGSEALYRIEVREDISEYIDLQERGLDISFDQSMKLLTWDAVPQAAKYRVKADYENFITSELSYDLNEYFDGLYEAANGFFNLDLAIIPLDENEKPLQEEVDGYPVSYKLVKEDIIFAPEKFGNCVVSTGTYIDHTTGLATLKGGKIDSLGIAGYNSYSNTYVAWKRDDEGNPLGLNDYVDFYFKGNNLPTMCLFADEVNGNMACGSSATLSEDKMNKGIVILNGVYGAYSGTLSRLASSDVVTVFGPNRIQSGWSNPNNRYCPVIGSDGQPFAYPKWLSSAKPYPYSLLTQDGLSLTPDANYKYTIGTYEENGNIMLDIRLYDMDHYGNNIYNIHYDTGIKTEELQPGAIIAYCPLKDGGADASFKVGKPYKSEPDLTFSGARFNNDGSVTLNGALPNTVGCGGHKLSQGAEQVSGYVAYKNTGIGDYVELEFTGNNMPYLTFLADNLTPGLADGKGYTIINGIISKNGLAALETGGETEFYTDRLRLFGPNRYGVSGNDHNYPMQTYTMNKTDPSMDIDTPAVFSQENLQAGHDYRMIAGLYRNQQSICLELILIDKTDGNKVLCDSSLELGLESDLKAIFGDALTGNIILHGAMKGLDEDGNILTTTFTRSATLVTRAEIEGIPASPRYTIAGGTIANSNPGNLCREDLGQFTKYMGWEGQYGVGTYIQFTFTGKNMPNVLLFADEINGNLSGKIYGVDDRQHTGYLLLNQMKTQGTGIAHNYEYFAVWGPNRISQNGDQLATDWCLANSYTGKSNCNDDLAAFQLNALDDKHTYVYTVGTKLVDGIVVIDMKLEDLTANTTATATVSTGKTEAELATALGKTEAEGHIVAYAALKGGESTSFMVTDPYEAE